MLAALTHDDRPLNLGSLAFVVGLHAMGLWLALTLTQIAPALPPAKTLYVQFIEPTAPAPVKPPEPLPPTPPRPVEKPKPKPLITTHAAEPTPNAIVAPPDPVEPEPLPPIEAAPAPGPEPEPVIEPPKYNLAYLNNPAPAYPLRSTQLGEEGTVVLRATITATGAVKDVEVQKSSGFPRLDQAALAAVRRWRFTPSKRGDTAIEGIAIIPMPFVLKKN